MKFRLVVFPLIFCLVDSAQAVRCFKPDDWEQNVDSLIQVSHLERINDPLIEVSLSMPEKYQNYEVSILSITQKKNDSEESAIVYPYKIIENGLVKSSLFVNKGQLENWSATVIYAEPQEVNIIKSDGCIVKSISSLKHNKLKNLRSLRSLGRAKDARPF